MSSSMPLAVFLSFLLFPIGILNSPKTTVYATVQYHHPLTTVSQPVDAPNPNDKTSALDFDSAFRASASAGHDEKSKEMQASHRNENTDVDFIPELSRGFYSYRKFIKATVTYAATEQATLSLNGVTISRTVHWSQHRQTTILVQRGDVLGIHGHSELSWHGMIVDIKIGSRHYVTGRNGFRSATSFMARYTHTQVGWNLRNSHLCNWKHPRVEYRPKNDIFSKTFPFSSGAKYVWIPPSSASDDTRDILMRYKFGGENCHITAVKPTKEPEPEKPAPESGNSCNCTQTSDEKGECFYFISTRIAELGHGFCKSSPCGPKFECLSNDNSANNHSIVTQCIRKYAPEEIRLQKRRNDGRLICERVKLNPPKPYYTPYV